MKTSYIITFIAIGLFSISAGCDSEPIGYEPTITQNPSQFFIRVLLNNDVKRISFRSQDDYRITNYDTMEISDIPGSDDFVELAVDNNSLRVGQQLFKTGRLIIQPQQNKPFVINDNQSYYGGLELLTNPGNNTMMLVNNVPLESYLAGVVASEMPSYWEAEALKAQAIAARTYVLYIKSKFGKNRLWDVKATQANQVYRGIRAETRRTSDAVNNTAGMVLCSLQESGYEQFPTYYSSVCGGHTENSENVFGDSFEPLKGVDCPWCRHNTKPSLFYWPGVKIDKKTVSENIFEKYPALKELGTIEKLEIAKESRYEGNFARITSVKLTGSARPGSPQAAAKTGFLRAEDLRLAIDSSGAKIQSASCTIVNLEKEFFFVSGKGFGHGVGLCQYGAREMARRGKTAEQILDYYYPGSRLKILY